MGRPRGQAPTTAQLTRARLERIRLLRAKGAAGQGTRTEARAAFRPIPAISQETQAKFWSLVDKGRKSRCWNWRAAKFPKGNGVLQVPTGRRGGVLMHAARVAYRLGYGRDPGPERVRHTCGNRSCCNPAHLALGSQMGSRIRGYKVTADQVRAMHRARRAGATIRAIAGRYGLDPSTVGQALKGRCWAGVAAEFGIVAKRAGRSRPKGGGQARGRPGRAQPSSSSKPRSSARRHAAL